jgi:hypothetical protein
MNHRLLYLTFLLRKAILSLGNKEQFIMFIIFIIFIK